MLDTLVKLVLLAFFVLFYLRRSTKILSKKILLVALYSWMLLFTLIGEPAVNLRLIVSYMYPVIFWIMVYGLGDKMQINKKHLVAFSNCVILIVMYCALYAILFSTEKFINALTLSGAYGYELTSFFVSNHEYGLYLTAGIVSCLVCLRIADRLSLLRRLLYLLAIAVFFVNLVLTYSRTSLFATIIFFAIFALCMKGKWRWRILLLALIALSVVFLSPTLSRYVFEVVLKENTDAGRADLYQGAIRYFQNSGWYEKVFGHGTILPRTYFEDEMGHGSVHNAYLQVLLYYGLLGLFVMVAFLLSQAYAAIRFMKTSRFFGAVFLGLVICASAMMFTNTTLVFNSPIDSYFLTIFMFIVPKYVRNAIQGGAFENENRPA